MTMTMAVTATKMMIMAMMAMMTMVMIMTMTMTMTMMTMFSHHQLHGYCSIMQMMKHTARIVLTNALSRKAIPFYSNYFQNVEKKIHP